MKPNPIIITVAGTDPWPEPKVEKPNYRKYYTACVLCFVSAAACWVMAIWIAICLIPFLPLFPVIFILAAMESRFNGQYIQEVFRVAQTKPAGWKGPKDRWWFPSQL